MSLFQPTRDEAREFLFTVRAKAVAGAPLTPLEATAARILDDHPEYHRHLDDPARWREHTWRPEDGETNPFLHLSLHLAIEEQLSIDHPKGIRQAVARLASRMDSAHDARHAVMDLLVEALWTAQRGGPPLSEAGYLEAIERKAAG